MPAFADFVLEIMWIAEVALMCIGGVTILWWIAKILDGRAETRRYIEQERRRFREERAEAEYLEKYREDQQRLEDRLNAMPRRTEEEHAEGRRQIAARWAELNRNAGKVAILLIAAILAALPLPAMAQIISDGKGFAPSPDAPVAAHDKQVPLLSPESARQADLDMAIQADAYRAERERIIESVYHAPEPSVVDRIMTDSEAETARIRASAQQERMQEQQRDLDLLRERQTFLQDQLDEQRY